MKYFLFFSIGLFFGVLAKIIATRIRQRRNEQKR